MQLHVIIIVAVHRTANE